jgi:sterol desaturase/sphingolipid hydroxylase (fatty acid hydroxylase superfamily)
MEGGRILPTGESPQGLAPRNADNAFRQTPLTSFENLPMTIVNSLMSLGLEKIFLPLMGPVFIATMALEAWWLSRRGRVQTYTWPGTAINVSLALSHAVADSMAWVLLAGLFLWVHEHRLFDFPLSAWSALGLLVLQDLCYYVFHRASHRVRWMWASHVTHHSGTFMNFSTALRQSPTYPISGMWVFWLPLAWLGFQPEHVVLCVSVSLAFQFFVHTESVRKLPGWVEAVFNTPSHHRVHHARNPQYIDRNYAGVFIVWDKLFGSFEPEHEACDYGIVKQIDTRNPLVMMFHEWRDLAHDVMQPGPLALRLRHVWAPPEWERPTANAGSPDSHGTQGATRNRSDQAG